MRAGKEIRSAVHHLTIAAGDVENLEAEIRTLKAKAAEVVAELRACQKRAALIAADIDNDPFRLGRESAWGNAADLVAEKLGVKETNGNP